MNQYPSFLAILKPHFQATTVALQLFQRGLSLGLCLATSVSFGTSALLPLPAQAKPSEGLSLYITTPITTLPASLDNKPSEKLSVPPYNRVATAHASIEVDSATDDGSGGCTLREAIESANTDTAVGGCMAGSGGDTITFAAGLNGRTITLAGTHLSLTSTMTIDGGGVITVSGNNASGVISVGQSSLVTLTGLTIRDGTGVRKNHQVLGGGIYVTLGSRITISDSTVALNTAELGVGISVDSYGGITIINSTVTSNTATYQGGGIYVFNTGITMTNSTVEANTADIGGGIYSYADIMLITNSTVVSNKATSNYGGGIFRYQIGDSSATIVNSCIVNNNDVAFSAGILSSVGIAAINNWWGSASGPSGVASGAGDSVSKDVTYAPFLTNPILGCPRSSSSPSPSQPALPTTDFAQKQIDEAQVQLAVATLATDIKVVPSGAGAGSNKTYEVSLVVQNTSPAAASAVLASLIMPSNLNVLSVKWEKEGQYYVDGNLPRTCSYDGRTAYCGIGQLWSGMKATITLRVTAPPGPYSVGVSAEDLSSLYEVTTQNRAMVNVNLN